MATHRHVLVPALPAHGLANKITQPDQDPVKLRATFDVHLSSKARRSPAAHR